MPAQNRRPLRARRLPRWLAFTGIVLASALTFHSLQQVEEESSGDWESQMESYEEMVALHDLDRGFRVDAGLEPGIAGDGLWARYLRWSWRKGLSRTTWSESVAKLLRELDDRVDVSPRGLAACAVAASMVGEDELAREMSVRLSANDSNVAEAYAAWIKSWLDSEKAEGDDRARLDEWARSLLEYEMNPEWWEARVVLDLAGQENPSESIRLLRGKESALVREWAWRHSLSQAVTLAVMFAALAGLLLLLRYKPSLRRVPGLTPVARSWGIWQMLGWFGWLTAAGYGVGFLLDALATIGGPGDDWQLVLWQIFQLAGAVWIWRLAGSPGLKLLGLRPCGEARPSRCFAPVFGFFALLTAYYLAMGFARADEGILDALLDTTESAQLEAIRWPGQAIFFSVLTGVVLAPVMEEVVHRGVLYQGLRARMGRWPAILLSAALFGILHLYSWWGILDVLVAGVFFAWIYDRTRSLWPGILLHAFGNALVTIDQWLLWGPR